MKTTFTDGIKGIFGEKITGYGYIEGDDITFTDASPGSIKKITGHGKIEGVEGSDGTSIFGTLFAGYSAIAIIFYILAIPFSWYMLIKSIIDGEDIDQCICLIAIAVIVFIICYLTNNLKLGKIAGLVLGIIMMVATMGKDFGIKSTFGRIIILPFYIALLLGFTVIPATLGCFIKRIRMKNHGTNKNSKQVSLKKNKRDSIKAHLEYLNERQKELKN